MTVIRTRYCNLCKKIINDDNFYNLKFLNTKGETVRYITDICNLCKQNLEKRELEK